MLRAPAAERNKKPILDVIRQFLQPGKKVLELASGTGQHITYFAENVPDVCFQPSDCDSRMLHSIVSFIDQHRFPNLRVPLFIDVSKRFDQWALPADFGPNQVDIVLNINMVHISSDKAVEGLFEASANLLNSSGHLILYGPFLEHGVVPAPSNIEFDRSLKRENHEWGLKEVEYVTKLANQSNLQLAQKVNMPANNFILVFSR